MLLFRRSLRLLSRPHPVIQSVPLAVLHRRRRLTQRYPREDKEQSSVFPIGTENADVW